MDAFGSAQGAVESLLSSLALVIRDDERLLGKVRGDVLCISDEMESMNGFLLDLNEASEDEDHQVRAWKKQVRDVAVESERWVQRYQRWAGKAPRSTGVLGCLRRIPHSVLTVSERRHIVTKIQELKARAQEVGDRGQRYGVDVPTKKDSRLQDHHPMAILGAEGVETEEEQYARRRWLVNPVGRYITEEDRENLIRWLTEEGDDIPKVRVIHVVGVCQHGRDGVATKVYDHESVASRFERRSWITVKQAEENWHTRMLEQLLLDTQRQSQDRVPQDVLNLMDKVAHLLKDRKFLIIFDGINDAATWEVLRSTLSEIGGADGSALMLITQNHGFLRSACNRTLNKVVLEPAKMYHGRAIRLVKNANREDEKDKVLLGIIVKLFPDAFSIKMLLHLLFVNPNRTLEQLQCLCGSLYDRGEWNNTRQMLLFCYNDLPKEYKSCLLYLSIFPPRWKIRKTTLLRRWVAEGLITRRAGMSMLDAAERCFYALLDRGLLIRLEPSASGKALVQMPYLVPQFIMEAAIADNVADLNLPAKLALCLSPGNGIQLPQVLEEGRRHDSCSRIRQSIFCNCKHDSCTRIRQSIICNCKNDSCTRIRQSIICNCKNDSCSRIRHSIVCNCKHGVPATESNALRDRDMAWLLGLLPTFERQGLIKVLDLEFCKGFQKHHLKNICQISELKFLNLMGTDVTKLPEDIDKLQNLEMLDIRQTEVVVLPAKIVYLRKLKHLISGNGKGYMRQGDGPNGLPSYELFSAVAMPDGIGQMTEMQVLSHVEVSTDNFDKLICELGRLHKLRKLGVVLHGKTKPHLHNLVRAIGKLGRCLRSLSIRFKPEADDGNVTDIITDAPGSIDMVRLPWFLQSIKLGSFSDGLPSCVLDLTQLVTVTLRETFLKNSDLRRLGKLANLSSLCLMLISSCEEADHLVFERNEYQNLKHLFLKHSVITHLCFEEGAAPRLERLLWTDNTVKALSGINHLTRLMDIAFKGSKVSKEVRHVIAVDPKPISVVY